MDYLPPQYTINHIIKLNPGRKAVLLVKGPKQSTLCDPYRLTKLTKNYTALTSCRKSNGFSTLLTPPFELIPSEDLVDIGGAKVKILSVIPQKAKELSRDVLTLAGLTICNGRYTDFPKYYPEALERNDWFWVATVEVITNA